MITVYYTDITQPPSDEWVQKSLARMPEDRIRIIEAIKHDTAKKLSAAAGLLLDHGLQQQGLAYRETEIEKGQHGKPYIAGDNTPYFNISHSGAKAVCAIADAEVGVDVEQIKSRKIRESLIRKVCTDAEKKYLQAIGSSSEQAEQFYKLWTVKESVMKQCGLGLAMDPGTIEAVRIFEQDFIKCRETMVKTCREQDYFISVCSKQEEAVTFRQVELNTLL